MSHLKYFCYPGFGEACRENTHYSQAVHVGDQLIISGQGGWNRETSAISADINEEVDQAFENVDHCLKHAGGKGWSEVFQVRLYMTDITEEAMGALVRNLKTWLPDHQPILTGVGVPALAIPGMHVEIEVSAHHPKEDAKA